MKPIYLQFNALHGKKVTREQVQKILNRKPKFSADFDAQSKLRNLLVSNPRSKTFSFEIENPLELGLNGIPVLSQAEELALLGTEAVQEGLGKAVSSQDIYKMVNDQMIELIKKDDLPPWKKTWKAGKNTASHGFEPAKNFVTKKIYSGINYLMLNFIYPSHRGSHWQVPYFLTFNQIEKKKGKIKQGAKALKVFYFRYILKYKGQLISEEQYIKLANQCTDGNVEICKDLEQFAMLKYYNVFAADDIEGIDWKFEVVEILEVDRSSYEIETCKAIVNAWSTKPPIKHGGDRAFYRPGADFIQMPNIEDFDAPQEYYSTLFHEMIHSTGAAHRLNRDFGGKFGDKKYAFEELIAELGASFLNAESGILYFVRDNSAAYLKGWKKELLKQMKDDDKFFFKASSAAQKGAEFILQRDDQDIPKYLKEFKFEPSKPKKKSIDLDKPIKPAKPKKKPVTRAKRKDPNQLALLGVQPMNGVVSDAMDLVKETKSGIQNVNEVIQVAKTLPKDLQSLVMGANNIQDLQPGEIMNIPGDIGEFFGKVEKKPRGSVVMTLDAPQGAGKTRFVFQIINTMANGGYRGLFASLEEDPQSNLFREKLDQYIETKNLAKFDVLGELPQGINTLAKLVEHYNYIVIDSWGKVGKADLDTLRRSFDGKFFIVIYQRTITGSMRGGSAAQFDGDMICKIRKDEVDRMNTAAYWDKNRYQVEEGKEYLVHAQKLNQSLEML